MKRLTRLLWCLLLLPPTSSVLQGQPPADKSVVAKTANEAKQPLADRLRGTLEADMPLWERKLLHRFQHKVYDSLTNGDHGCIDCHSSDGTSALVLSGNPLDDFRLLLDNRYLATSGPDTLLGRITSNNPDRRMPKHADSWSKTQIEQLRKLVTSVDRLQEQTGLAADEQFPRSLLGPYHDFAWLPSDNQFISYRQLQGKTKVVFDDDWKRGDRDLFSEQVAMFGGADFQTRFNESSEPTATYLTALEILSRDVASQAYQRSLGPFSNWAAPTSSAAQLSELDGQHKRAISQLYRHILYRSPTPEELKQAFELLKSVHALEEEISKRDTKLVFDLTVTDPITQHSHTRTIEMPVSGEPMQVRQVIINQREPAEQPAKNKKAPLGRIKIGDSVYLAADRSGQRVVLHNDGTHRNVSFAGMEILNQQAQVLSRLTADAPEVQVEGAWELNTDGGLRSFEDGNRHKGASSITVALSVAQDGLYQIVLLYRPQPTNTPHALVQLVSPEAGNELQPLTWPAIPELGSATFHFDCSNDTVPFVELPGAYQFDEHSFVEISNAGTHFPVTAGAVEFIPLDSRLGTILIDSADAVGREGWSEFDEGRFRAYNVKGQKLHDDNKNKGQLSLRYHPAEESQLKRGNWRPQAYYRIRVYYPGKREQETQVPIKIVALQSSPIVQIAHPQIAKADAWVRLDASASYTVHGEPLQFHWRQVSGPSITLPPTDQATLEFLAPRLPTTEVAWTALCSALLRHPDFLFTRPPSLAWAEGEDQRRLQIVKLALDLVGRPPTAEELARFDAGQEYSAFVDFYLNSDEFRQFYFHRIRLYLESQGTEVQDEPARLWSYIAFNDRPFQEILIGEYTVDTNFNRQERPDYHGRTGLLTTAGFIQGKPGLPHYNYSAQVSMLFLGYVYEVPPEVVEQREGVTALGTTDPDSTCYSCHKILTPLAFQRLNWTDDGEYQIKDEQGLPIDASDGGSVEEYPFAGQGLEAFALQAAKKERFIRTIINTHFNFYFGRPMRHREDERELYQRLWNHVHQHDFKLRELIRAIVTSREYLAPT